MTERIHLSGFAAISIVTQNQLLFSCTFVLGHSTDALHKTNKNGLNRLLLIFRCDEGLF